MTSPRNPSIGFKITVALVVVLAGYPLSFGPACWLSSWLRYGGERLIPTAYRPILMTRDSSESFFRISEWYAELGAREGWSWVEITTTADDGTVDDHEYWVGRRR
jgi:hypothetical protein